MKKPGVRALAGRALDRIGALDRFFWLRARLGRRELAVLTYHRVGTIDDVGELDPGVFEAAPEGLEAQLAVIRAHCTVVSLADVRRFCRGRKLPPNPVLVTFDDGYVDNLEVATPILRRASVPATFFIPTSFPDAGKLFWWDRVWLSMRRCRRDEVELGYPERLVLHPTRAPGQAARLVCQAIKRARDIELGRLWEAIDRDAGVSLGAAEERALATRTILSWDGVQKLRDAGMDVQSHSHEHIVLNSITPEAALRDLVRSARVLREALGVEAFSLAYPVGYELRGAMREVPREAGFEMGFTNGTGRCDRRRFDPWNFPRISMDLDMTSSSYKTRLLFGDRRWSRPSWPPPAVPTSPPHRYAIESAPASGA